MSSTTPTTSNKEEVTKLDKAVESVINLDTLKTYITNQIKTQLAEKTPVSGLKDKITKQEEIDIKPEVKLIPQLARKDFPYQD